MLFAILVAAPTTWVSAQALEWDTISNNGSVDGAAAGVRNWFDAGVWGAGGANRSWSSGVDTDAIFGAMPGVVMLDSGGGTGVTVDDLNFQVDGYSILPLAQQTLKLGGGEGAHVITVNAGTASIGTLFDTSGEGFEKAGAGKLVFSNASSLSNGKPLGEPRVLLDSEYISRRGAAPRVTRQRPSSHSATLFYKA